MTLLNFTIIIIALALVVPPIASVLSEPLYSSAPNVLLSVFLR